MLILSATAMHKHVPVMDWYPGSPPDAPISATNVVPLSALMLLGVNPVQLVQRGAVVHSFNISRVRLSGIDDAGNSIQ